MLAIQIPPQFMAGATNLLGAEQHTFEALMSEINTKVPRADLQALVESIVSKSQSEFFVISSIIDFLLFVNYQRQSAKSDPVSIDEYVSVIQRSILMQQPHLLETEKSRKRLREVLTSFLNAEGGFGLSLKANILLTQNERNFSRVRIISDIRTLFEEENVDKAIGAVICHVLKIEYVEFGVHKEFYCGLDNGELVELREAAERAERKTDTLRKILESANVPCIEHGSEIKE